MIARKKPLKRKRKATGERELFLKIWDERPHICTNRLCRRSLGDEPMAYYFAHVLSKGSRPDLRLDPENIVILCLSCHCQYDQGDKKLIELPGIS